ncbi:hypothetical protein [Kitasatospora sp. NPDC085879]|uniref:hypothetical protein n=1 Tax=Kitasatospora sp. NPDC085879 TaxID=3154769 RepID=UPI0034299963
MAAGPDTARLLRLMARTDPRIWEILFPHLPLTAEGRAVALNPQPLPPVELLGAAARRTAVGVAEAAVAAHIAGRDPREVLQDADGDWCPQPPYLTIPWPKKWPLPWPPGEPYPIDPEWAAPAVQATAGMVLQSYAEGILDKELSAAFGASAEKLLGAALNGG